MRRQLLRLERLVNDLLDVSRIMAGKLPFLVEDVDLAALVREVVERLGTQLQSAKCETSVDADRAIVGLWDRMRLDQIVTNLLTNAMKYGAGRPIEVRVDGDDHAGRLTVRDHGIGISDENQKRIFEKFERVVSERSYGGLGLGLWIVSRIVSDFDGSVHVESAPGTGATFTVELPRRPKGVPRPNG